MQGATRVCFENRTCRQAPNRVRRVYGQQVECEGSGPQSMVCGFSLNSTFPALSRHILA